MLDSYVAWLDKKGTKPKTIADYVSAIRKFLAYIDIQASAFKSKVTMPRITKIDDKPLNLDDLRQVLTKGRPNR